MNRWTHERLHVLHGLLKQHQVHVGVQLIVVLQRISQCFLQLLPVTDLRVTRFSDTVGKVRIDQRLVDED